MDKTCFLSIKIGKNKSIAEFGARFFRKSQILKTTGGLSNFDSTIALRQAITGHKELSLAMIKPLMQGRLASTLVYYMIKAQDTLDLLKSQTKEIHKPISSNNNNNHGNKPTASEDKTDTQSKKLIMPTQNPASSVRIAAKLAMKQKVVSLRRKMYTL